MFSVVYDRVDHNFEAIGTIDGVSSIFNITGQEERKE